jgi:hypothetical protein
LKRLARRFYLSCHSGLPSLIPARPLLSWLLP